MTIIPKQWKIPWSGRSHDYTEEEIQFISDLMRSADPLTQGKYLKQFEQCLSSYLGVSNDSVFVANSATSALEMIAALVHLEDGDEVIIPAHTFTASALPFLRRKAKIVWADIDPETWVIDVNDVKKKITEKTKVIVLVHLYGMLADIVSFQELNKTGKIIFVEDTAQAFGAKYKGRKAGVFSDFGAFSFHGQKNMTTLGEGGAIYVKDPTLAEIIPSLRSFGARPFANQEYYWKPAMGNITSVLDWELPNKFTISEVACAIGAKLLERVDELNEQRKKRYWQFRDALRDYPELKFQKIPSDVEPAYHLMPAMYEAEEHQIHANRDDLIKGLAFDHGIQAIVQYCPLYRYDLYRHWGCGEAHCDNTDNFFDSMISFPFHVWMKDADFDYMIQSTKIVLQKLRG